MCVSGSEIVFCSSFPFSPSSRLEPQIPKSSCPPVQRMLGQPTCNGTGLLSHLVTSCCKCVLRVCMCVFVLELALYHVLASLVLAGCFIPMHNRVTCWCTELPKGYQQLSSGRPAYCGKNVAKDEVHF